MSDGGSADKANVQLGDVPVPVTCLPCCHWEDDSSDPASGRMTPKAVQAAGGCLHATSRYIETVLIDPTS